MIKYKIPQQAELRQNESGFLAILAWIVVILVVFVGIIAAFKYESTHRTSNISEIKSGIAGYCVDLYHDKTSQGAVVDSWPCNGTNSQSWLATDNVIRHDGNYCLSIDQNKIVSSSCNGSADQTWVNAIGGYENPSSSRCLSLLNNQTDIQLSAASCDSLTKQSELWAQSIWKPNVANTAATISCADGTEGQKIACVAAKQWVIWQSGSPSHSNLLNTYSDGNGYEEWCADFVSYVYQQAGYPFTNGERSGWDEYLAPNIVNQGLAYHSADSGYVPQTGDIAYFDYTGGHVEIVAIGGTKPVFIYGDSGKTDRSTGNGEMTENSITNDGVNGQVMYYLSPS